MNNPTIAVSGNDTGGLTDTLSQTFRSHPLATSAAAGAVVGHLVGKHAVIGAAIGAAIGFAIASTSLTR